MVGIVVIVVSLIRYSYSGRLSPRQVLKRVSESRVIGSTTWSICVDSRSRYVGFALLTVRSMPVSSQTPSFVTTETFLGVHGWMLGQISFYCSWLLCIIQCISSCQALTNHILPHCHGHPCSSRRYKVEAGKCCDDVGFSCFLFNSLSFILAG